MSKVPQSVVVICGTFLMLAPMIVHAVIEANVLYAEGIAARREPASGIPSIQSHGLPTWMLVTSMSIGAVMIAIGVVSMLFGSNRRSD